MPSRTQRHRFLIVLLLTLPLLFAVQLIPIRAATFTVTKTADTADGICDADCSLREAVIAANASSGADLITIPAGLYALTLGGTGENAAATGDLDITDDVTLQGAGPGATIIAGCDYVTDPSCSGIDRIFDTHAPAVNLTFRDMTLTRGYAQSENGGALQFFNFLTRPTALIDNVVFDRNTSRPIGSPSGGGALGAFNVNLTINNSVFTDNVAGEGSNPGFGGAILTESADLLITNSRFTNNQTVGGSTQGEAGAIRLTVSSARTTTIINSTFTGNSSGGTAVISASGYQAQTINLINSTFANNYTTRLQSGVIQLNVPGTLNVINSTMVNNTGGYFGAGAIAIQNCPACAGTAITANIINSTIVDNQSYIFLVGLGPGVGGLRVGAGTMTVTNSIVAGNTVTDTDLTPSDCAGVTSGGGNVFGINGNAGGCSAGVNDVVGAGALSTIVNALASNGGVTQTMSLPAGSPAINNGLNSGLPADTFDLNGNANTTEALPVDQRGAGFPRVLACDVDSGAFEAAATGVPTYSILGDQTVNEDSGAASVAGFLYNFVPSSSCAAISSVVVTPTGSPTVTFSAAPAIALDGTLTFTPAADDSGSAAFTVVAYDDNGTPGDTSDDLAGAPLSFTITVNPVNDAPTFTPGGAVTVNEDSGAYSASWATAISPGPANEAAQTVAFAITGNTNPALFSAAPAIAPDGTLTFTPAANANGSADLTVVLQDNGGTANGGVDTSAPVTLTITVNPVNDAPTFTPGGAVTVNEDSGAYSASWATAISPGPANEAAQTVAFAITGNTNPALFSAAPAIAPDGTLTFTPAANANGSADLTVVLQDNGGTANGGVDTSAPVTLTITVNPVNDAPTFTPGGAVNVIEGSGAYSAPWATAISPGPADEAAQTVAFAITGNTNPALFSVAPAIAPDGTLTFTPAAAASGSADLTVVLQDNGGTANGGVDTSAPVTFNIEILDAAALLDVDLSVSPAAQPEPGGPFTYSIRVANIGTSGDSVTVTTLSDSLAGDVTALSGTTCVLPQTIAAGGDYTCTYTVILTGQPGTSRTASVSASGIDEDGAPVSDTSGLQTVTITNVIGGGIVVTLSASPTTLNEPGGAVIYTLTVTNLSAIDAVSIGALTGGGSIPTAALTGCLTGTTLTTGAPGNTASCSFTIAYTGLPGDSFTGSVTVSATDDDGQPLSATSAPVTVTIIDVGSALTIVKAADAASVPAEGGTVSFTVTLTNTSAADAVTIAALTDIIDGTPVDLNGSGTCAVPQTIAPGGSYTCVFPYLVTGAPGATISDVVTASGTDDDGAPVSGQSNTVVIGIGALPPPTPTPPPAIQPPVSTAPTLPVIPFETFLCDNLALRAGTSMTASGGTGNILLNGVRGDTFCRIIILDAQVITALAEVGIPALVSQPIAQAVDLFGLLPDGTSVVPFVTPVNVCLRGAGTVYFLSAFNRAPVALASGAGSICVSIPNAGTLVLVGQLAPAGSTASAPLLPAGPAGETPLTACMVRTEYLLRLRSTPSTASSDNIIGQVPYNVLLTATAYTPGWYRVDYLGTPGYLAEGFVTPIGDC
ncbi:MAG: beta strand repeat-containing protein [Candidatus Flexifilum sp.]